MSNVFIYFHEFCILNLRKLVLGEYTTESCKTVDAMVQVYIKELDHAYI